MADRFRLFHTLGEVLRYTIGRHYHNIAAVQSRRPRNERSREFRAADRACRIYGRIKRLREMTAMRSIAHVSSCPLPRIAQLLGLDRRTVQRSGC
ncbi:hypothetical protein [Bradyrhizobium sp. NAS80.1]|uniref:hypothetical protein n=1 Tax=Bradyrhizobium sp. NAS80.1 TaxID=1680159 RepID=UPI001160FCC1|nr:hypothetical protein [Bradyrhizobium sp. NAS80.1]